MSSRLGEVVAHIQNPALGAVLQWRFVLGYVSKHPQGAGCPVVLLFIVLPTLLHESTYTHLKGTIERSGLRTFAEKFSRSDTLEADLLYALHDRVASMRAVSLEALQIALASKLIAASVDQGVTFPVTTAAARRGIPRSIQTMAKNAEKLGAWCAELSLHQVAATLKVRF
jgi:hypothetical protein